MDPSKQQKFILFLLNLRFTTSLNFSKWAFVCEQAVTVGVHGEEKKKRLHVLTALVLFFFF